MSMIEKVARAIAANKRGLEPNDPAIDSKWQSYCGQARAAIEAMMEPTPEMAEAGAETIVSHFSDSGPSMVTGLAADVFSQMLRTASDQHQD
jgi:hypothetical protein